MCCVQNNMTVSYSSFQNLDVLYSTLLYKPNSYQAYSSRCLICLFLIDFIFLKKYLGKEKGDTFRKSVCRVSCSDSGDSDGVDSKTDSPKKARKADKREEKNNKEAEKERRKKQSHEKVLIKHFVLIVTELWCQVSYQKQFTVVSMLFNSSFAELLLFLIFPSIIVAFHSVHTINLYKFMKS